jgi:hypothetical protein
MLMDMIERVPKEAFLFTTIIIRDNECLELTKHIQQ